MQPWDILDCARSLLQPVSLILGPLKQIQSNTSEATTLGQARIALRNAHVIMRTLDQLITFNLLQSGQAEFSPQRVDIVDLIQSRVIQFQDVGLEKGLAIKMTANEEIIEADVDVEMLIRTMDNLLHNAVQHTEASGKITVLVEASQPGALKISVTDSGCGMGEEELSRAEAQFPGMEMNAGRPSLGLPLVKKMVEMHGGTMRINSILDMGTKVSLQLPRWQEMTTISTGESLAKIYPTFESASGDIRKEIISTGEWDSNDRNGNLILLVEHDSEVREYLRLCLEPDFRLLEASDLDSGLAQLSEAKPDLVICGQLLAGRQNLQICEALRSNKHSAHIPCILLGESKLKFRIRSLEAGADACLDRFPEMDELKAIARRLLTGRKQYRQFFRSELASFAPATTNLSQEEKLLNGLRAAMAQHLADEDFSTTDLAAEVAMSRTQLHRKLKAICNQSATTFMRNYRLEHAYQLLEKNVASVGEIAFMVGFGSASYFTRSFSAKFGVNPKDIQKKRTTSFCPSTNVLRTKPETKNEIRISA